MSAPCPGASASGRSTSTHSQAWPLDLVGVAGVGDQVAAVAALEVSDGDGAGAAGDDVADLEFVDLDAHGDEAHRIRESSNHRFTPKDKRSSRRQIEELLNAARVPVFLLDEHQVVRPGEMGTVNEIDAAAKAKNLTVRHVDLEASSTAAAAAPTNSGCCVCWAWLRVAPPPSTAMTSSPSPSRRVRKNSRQL